MKDQQKHESLFRLQTQGFSLIEVLIAVGMLGILSMAFISFISTQQKETARLALKLSLQDVESDIRTAVSDPAKCLFNFGAGALSFNATTVPAAPAAPLNSLLITLPLIRAGDAPTSRLIVQDGAPVPVAPTAVVDEIYVSNWVQDSPDLYNADVFVRFTPETGPIAPLRVANVKFQTNPASPLGAKVVTGCSFTGVSAVTGNYRDMVSNDDPIDFPAGIDKNHNLMTRTITVPAAGSPKISIDVTVLATAAVVNTHVYVVIEKDGVDVYVNRPSSHLAGYNMTHHFTYVDDTPGAGPHTYTVWLGNNYTAGVWTNVFSTAIIQMTSN